MKARSRKTIVGICVMANEHTLQRQVRQAGGSWDAQQKVWYMPYETVMELGLEERIVVPENADGNGEGVSI